MRLSFPTILNLASMMALMVSLAGAGEKSIDYYRTVPTGPVLSIGSYDLPMTAQSFNDHNEIESLVMMRRSDNTVVIGDVNFGSGNLITNIRQMTYPRSQIDWNSFTPARGLVASAASPPNQANNSVIIRRKDGKEGYSSNQVLGSNTLWNSVLDDNLDYTSLPYSTNQAHKTVVAGNLRSTNTDDAILYVSAKFEHPFLSSFNYQVGHIYLMRGNNNGVDKIPLAGASGGGKAVGAMTGSGRIALGLGEIFPNGNPDLVFMSRNGMEYSGSYWGATYPSDLNFLFWANNYQTPDNPNTANTNLTAIGGIFSKIPEASGRLPGVIDFTLADINGNGRKEIIAITDNSHGQAGVYVGTLKADQGSQYPTQWYIDFTRILTPGNVTGVAAGDINRTGRVDLFFTSTELSSAFYYTNFPNSSAHMGVGFSYGNTLFHWSDPLFGRPTKNPILADVDGDGDLDFVMVDAQTRHVYIVESQSPVIGPRLEGIDRRTPSVEKTNASTLEIEISFDRVANGLTKSDLRVYGTYQPLPAIDTITQSSNGRSYYVTVKPSSNTIKAGSIGVAFTSFNVANYTHIKDDWGNSLDSLATVPLDSYESYDVDRKQPKLNNLKRASSTGSAMTPGTATFEMNFSKAVGPPPSSTSGFLRFSSDNEASGASISSVNQTSSTRYAITVNTGTTAGLLELEAFAAGGISDAFGNTLSTTELPRRASLQVLGSPTATYAQSGGQYILTINAHGNTTANITRSGSNIFVNGTRPYTSSGTFLTVPRTQVTRIVYHGDSENDTVNLSTLSRSDLSTLNKLTINGGSGGTSNFTLPNFNTEGANAVTISINPPSSGNHTLNIPGAGYSDIVLNGNRSGNGAGGALTFSNIRDITLGSTDNTLEYTGSALGFGTINAGGGTNTLVYSRSNAATINLAAGTLAVGSLSTNIMGFTHVESGTSSNLTLTGSSGSNTLVGGTGNDQINGGSGGSNTLIATGGNNSLTGGPGADTLIAGPGNDTLSGGAGNDRYVFPSNTGGTNTIVEGAGNGNDTIDMTALSNNHTITISTSGIDISGGGYTVQSSGLHLENILMGGGADNFVIDATGPNELRLNGMGDTTYEISLTDNLVGEIVIDEQPSGGTDTLHVQGGASTGLVEIRPTGIARLDGDEEYLIAFNSNVENVSYTGGPGDDEVRVIPMFEAGLNITIDGGGGTNNKLVVATPDSADLVETFDGPRSGTLEQGDNAVITFLNFDDVEYENVTTDYMIDNFEVTSEGIFANSDDTFRAVAPVTINGFLVYRMGGDVLIDPDNNTLSGSGGQLVISDMDGMGDFPIASGEFQINTLTGALTDVPTIRLGGIPLIATSQVIDEDKLVFDGTFDHGDFDNTSISGLELSASGISLANGHYQLGPAIGLFQFTPDTETYTPSTFEWSFTSTAFPGTEELALSVGANDGSPSIGGSVKASCEGSDCIELIFTTPQFPASGGIWLTSGHIEGVAGATISISNTLIDDEGVALGEGVLDVSQIKIEFSDATFAETGVTAASALFAVGEAVSISLTNLLANRDIVSFDQGNFTLSGFNVVLEEFSFDEVHHEMQAASATLTVGAMEMVLANFAVNSAGEVSVSGASITEGDITLALFDPEFQSNRISVTHGEITGIADTTLEVEDLLIRDGEVRIGVGKASIASFEIDIEEGDFSSSGVTVAEASMTIAGQSISLTDFAATSTGVTLGQGLLAVSGFNLELDEMSFLTSPNRFAAANTTLHISGIGDASIQNFHVDSAGHISASGGSFQAGPVHVALSNPDFQSDHIHIGEALLEVDGQEFEVTNLLIVSNGVTMDSGHLDVSGVKLDIEEGVFLGSGFSASKADLHITDVGSINAEDIAVSSSGFSLGKGGFEFGGFAVEIGAGTPEGGVGLRLSCLLELPSNLSGARAGITFTVIGDTFKLEAFEFCTPQDTFVANSNFALPALCFSYYEDTDGAHVWEGSGDFNIPGVFTVEGNFKIIDGFLDDIGAGIDNMNLPIGETGAYLQSIHAEVGNLSREVRHWSVNVPVLGKLSGFGIPPLFFEGVVGATAGPTVEGQALMRGTVTMYFDQDQMALKGSVQVLIITVGEAWFTAKYAERAAGFGGWMTYSSVLEGGGEVRVQIGGSVSGSAYLAVKIPDDVPLVGGKSVGSVDASFQTHPTQATAGFKILGWKVSMSVRQGHVSFDTKDMALRHWERPHRHYRMDKSAGGHIVFNDSVYIQDRVYSDGVASGSGASYKTGEGVYTLNVTGTEPVLIRVNYENPGAKSHFMLTAPDGSVYEHDIHVLDERNHDQFAHWYEVPGALDAGFLVPKPIEGDYIVEILEPSSLGEHVVEILRQIPPPEIEIVNVYADGQDLAVEWDVNHIDENTTVTLFLDRGREHFTGDPLVGPFPGRQGTSTWAVDLSGESFIPGVYYIYMEAFDGFNPPVRKYYDAPVFIGNVDAPAAVENIQATIEDGTAIVVFNVSDDMEDIVSFRLDYSPDTGRLDYREGVTIPVDSQSGIIDGLEDGRNYRFRIIPIRQVGRTDPNRGDLLELVKGAAAPYISGKSGKSPKSMHRNDLVGEMRDEIINQIVVKGAEGIANLGDNQLQSLAQQAAMTAIYGRRLHELRRPSKELDAALAQLELKRATKETTETMELGEPVQVSSFEMFSFTATARTLDGNALPIVLSNPPPTGHVGTPYVYQIVAVDPEGAGLTFDLVEGPEGMTVSPDGLVEFTPTEGGVSHVVVGISDGIATITHEWPLQAGTINVYPNLWFATRPPTVVVPGEVYHYNLHVSGGTPGGNVDLTLLEGPDGMTLDGKSGGLVWESPETEGSHRVVILATQDDPARDFESEAVQSFQIDVTTTQHQHGLAPVDTRIRDWNAAH